MIGLLGHPSESRCHTFLGKRQLYQCVNGHPPTALDGREEEECYGIDIGRSPRIRTARSCRDVPTRASPGVMPDDLYIQPEPWPRIGRPPKHDVEAWTVTDDWPDAVPITEAELDVFEAWFGDLFDELFGPCR